MSSPHRLSLALLLLAAGCGSKAAPIGGAASGPDTTSVLASDGGGAYTCVPDDYGTIQLTSVAAACPPGTHAVPSAGGGDAGAPTSDAGAAPGAGGPHGGPSPAGGGDGSRPPPPGAGGSPTPPLPALCSPGGANSEPDILVGYLPANGQTVGQGGQIKVWVNDEGATIIAPGEQIDASTGVITTPGDRTATAPDGYLWEPALYIAPASAEKGGAPHFPTMIRGNYNNNPQNPRTAGTVVSGMDAPPPGSVLPEKYTSEIVWDVSSLGLVPGTYVAEFVVHDGDKDRGVGCVTIVIQ